MGGDAVERLMEIVLQMKINMAHINETLQLQTTEIRQQLSVIFDDQRKSLEGHLGAIDAKLKDCSCQVADYQRLYASLAAMRAKLDQLGESPGTLPAPLASDTLEGFLAWRLDQLRERGEI
ncbi:MAG TPA: hypothetical protein VMR20_01445 [Verrucomicrobiae bacterium]|nr:hypothetical protein [Verrucomicrobiae bacterium]